MNRRRLQSLSEPRKVAARFCLADICLLSRCGEVETQASGTKVDAFPRHGCLPLLLSGKTNIASWSTTTCQDTARPLRTSAGLLSAEARPRQVRAEKCLSPHGPNGAVKLAASTRNRRRVGPLLGLHVSLVDLLERSEECNDADERRIMATATTATMATVAATVLTMTTLLLDWDS